MDWVQELTDQAEGILTTKWDVRDGTVIPASEDVTLKDGAVKLEATFLYADLANSSKLAKVCPWETTAKIIRSYLACCTRLIIAYSGKIRSFDGDRVMGVFIGDHKNAHAVKCAREIDWVVEKIINPKAREKFKSIQENDIHIRHAVGIDTGEAVAVRAGIRENNDLIWIGEPPSFAAKLSELREYPYCIFISKKCFSKLRDAQKEMSNGELVWEERGYEFAGEKRTIYRSKYTLQP